MPPITAALSERPIRESRGKGFDRFWYRTMPAGSGLVPTFLGLLGIRNRTRIVRHEKGGADHCDRDLAPWARRRHRAAGDTFQVGKRRIAVRARTEPRRWHRRGPFCCRQNRLTAGYLLLRLPHRFAQDHRLDGRKAQEVAQFCSGQIEIPRSRDCRLRGTHRRDNARVLAGAGICWRGMVLMLLFQLCFSLTVSSRAISDRTS
jgi:hypothetical protein